MRVAAVEGDDGARIQAAIDFVSKLPLDKKGVRGAVQLEAGRYEIEGNIRLSASGVVLRGAGSGERGTTLVATGSDRRALIVVSGAEEGRLSKPLFAVADDHVPVGSRRMRLKPVGLEGEKTTSKSDARPRLESGMRLRIERPSSQEWIHALGMDESPARQPYSWKVGAFNVVWDRVVEAVNGDSVVLDAPLTTRLDASLGAALVSLSASDGKIETVGIENLRCVSEVSSGNAKDENHAWNAIEIHRARDAWVCDVAMEQFCGTAVLVGATAARVTVQDCRSLRPISEDGGYRRMAFHAQGQQVLFLRCFSEHGRNDFTSGYLTAGPVVSWTAKRARRMASAVRWEAGRRGCCSME